MGRRNHGLLHSLRRIEVEDVKSSHKKPCAECGEKPVGRRLHVRQGSGRSSQVLIYCSTCGTEKLVQLTRDTVRAMDKLQGHDDAIGEKPIRYHQ